MYDFSWTICSAECTAGCTFCAAPLCDEQSVCGQQSITVRRRVSTTVSTALHGPEMLSTLLLSELDRGPYCSAWREKPVIRRQAGQLKLLAMLALTLLAMLATA